MSDDAQKPVRSMEKDAMSNDAAQPVRSTLQRRMPWIFTRFLVGTAAAFLVLAATMPIATGGKMSLPTMSWFLAFALLPGITGLANYIVTFRQRDAEPGGPHGTNDESSPRPKFREAFAAAMLLPPIFLTLPKPPSLPNPPH